MSRGTILVTGASRGIGAATARLLAPRGADLALACRTPGEEIASVARDCRAAGARTAVIGADLAVEADVVRMVDDAVRELGPLAGLVANAGAAPSSQRVEDMSADRIDEVLTLNLRAAVLCSREAVRRMALRHGGSGGAIVHVSSRAAVLGAPEEWVDYAAAKAGTEALTVGLAKEVAADGIRVNAVRPGLIDTEFHARAGEPGRAARVASAVPMARPGQPEEVAGAIAWLLGDEASYVTGAILDVTGGR